MGTWAILQYTGLTACMWLAWRTTPDEARLRAPTWLLLCGIAARLVLLPVDGYLSNDAERYLWDGRVALEGLDPYRTAPDDPRLATLRTQWPTPAEHAAYPTLYPPAALAVFSFAAAAGVDASVWVWKGLCAGAGLGTLFFVLAFLRRTGAQRHFALVALSPLLVLETGIGAHVDAFSTLGIAVALWATTRGEATVAGIALGCGALFKLLPALAVLPVAVAFGRPGAWRCIAGAGGAIGVGYGAALALGLRPAGSLWIFFERWRFGSPLFDALDRLSPSGFVLPVVLFLGGGAFAAALWSARRGSVVSGVQIALLAPLALSPVVFPWYLSALVPGLAAAPSVPMLAWISLHPLTYEVLNGFQASGRWDPADWPLVAIAGGVGIAAWHQDGRRWRLCKRRHSIHGT
ncbi:MAG: hypothetical protein AAF430_20860 [Myxococcota bacterium]